MTPYKRINLFGGPCAGKSTMAHYLMWWLKSNRVQVEFCREWIKRMAHRGQMGDRFLLQPIACGHQLQEELDALSTGCVVVSESPVLLQAAYANNKVDIDRSILTAQELDRMYPTLNVLLIRGDRQYDQKGRWESEAEARQKDDTMRELLELAGLPYIDVRSGDWDKIREVIRG